MRVEFSYDVFRMQRHGGISRYVAELHQGLLRRGCESRIDASLHLNGHLRGLPNVRGLNVSALRPAIVPKAVSKLVDPWLERAQLRAMAPSTIYHKTYYSPHPPRHAPLVVTVYDMIHERFPYDFEPNDPTARWKRAICERADIVFAISAATRDDLLARCAVDPDRVLVTHLGVQQPMAASPPDAATTGRVLLFVGDRYRRYKNFAAVLDALTRLDPDVRLVCFGGGAFSPDELRRLAELRLLDRVEVSAGDLGTSRSA